MIFLFSVALAAPFSPAFSSTEGMVELPWNDFDRLYRTWMSEQDREVAPRAWTLDRAVFAGSVVGTGEGAYATLRLRLRGTVHTRDGWAAVPLLGASAALRSAKIDGKDATLYVQDGFYTLLTDRPGAFDAELDIVVRTFESEGETGFTLPLPAAGATVVALAVPSAEPLAFEVPGAQGLALSSAGDERRVEAFVPAMTSLTVTWRRAVEESKEKREARVYAETRTLVGVSEGVLACKVDIDYTILHAPVDRFALRLPADVTVLELRGKGIRSWAQAKDGTLDVALNYGATGTWKLGIDYERANPAGPLPLVRLAGVTRETDYIGVDARSAMEIVAGAPSGAVPIDVRELPASITGQTDYPVLLAYRARGGEVGIPLEIRQHPDMDMLVTLVDTASADTLVTRDGRRMTRVRYGVRNNRRQILRLKLPAGASVWSAAVAGRAVKVGQGAEAGVVLIPLVRSDASGGALSAFQVELVYVEAGAPLDVGRGGMRISLPTIDAPTSVLQWSIWTPTTLTVLPKTAEGTVHLVTTFSAPPVLPAEAVVTQAAQAAVRAEVANQGETGTLGLGVAPVHVEVPLTGNVTRFERTLVIDEELWAGFDYRGAAR
ncbi:MAG: hypothetical protein Q8P18_02800 [Pseudomonadota bacterium]|nr:hypothetical protein [Pseudomonadota bacterium]